MFSPDAAPEPDQRANKPPPRRANSESRTREHLTPAEVERMIAAVRKQAGRMAERDALIILLAYRHGLRLQELARLRWEQVDFKAAHLHVVRLKHGSPSTHPLRGPELRALRAWRRQQEAEQHTEAYVFTSLSKTPLSARSVHHLIALAGRLAKLPFTVHPHMLRHACGFYLANQGVDTRAIQLYLGHKNINHTVRYTELAPGRFKNFWND